MSFKFIGRNGDTVRYSATFWQGPETVGEQGSRYNLNCSDTWFPPVYRDGELKRRGGFLNTSPNVSYYPALLKASGFKEF